MIIAFSKAGSGRCELHTFLHHRGLLSCKQHLSSGNTGGDSTSVPSWIYFQGSFTFHQQLSEWFTSGGHYGKVKNKHAPSQFPGTPPFLVFYLFIWHICSPTLFLFSILPLQTVFPWQVFCCIDLRSIVLQNWPSRKVRKLPSSQWECSKCSEIYWPWKSFIDRGE